MYQSGSNKRTVVTLIVLLLIFPFSANALDLSGLGIVTQRVYQVQDGGIDWLKTHLSSIQSKKEADKRLFFDALAAAEWRVALDHLQRWKSTLKASELLLLKVAEIDLLQRLGFFVAAEEQFWSFQSSRWEMSGDKDSIAMQLRRIIVGQVFWLEGHRVLALTPFAADKLELGMEVIRHRALSGEGAETLNPHQGSAHPSVALAIGLREAARGNLQAALNHLRMTRQATTIPARVQNAAKLGIGRILYEADYRKEALTFYREIGPNHPEWAEIQEEMGWAYLKQGKSDRAMERVLATRRGLSQDRFLPGLDLLAVSSEFKRCNYVAATNEVASFKRKYQGIRTSVSKISKIQKESWMRSVLSRRADEITSPFFREIALSEPVRRHAHLANILKKEKRALERAYRKSEDLPLPSTGQRQYYREYVKQVERKISARNSKLSAELTTQTQLRLAELNRLAKIVLEVDFLVVDQVRRRLADRVIEVKEQKMANLGDVSPSQEVWSFESEFWLDEIGKVASAGGNLCL